MKKINGRKREKFEFEDVYEQSIPAKHPIHGPVLFTLLSPENHGSDQACMHGPAPGLD
jgi:hypothetical protein